MSILDREAAVVCLSGGQDSTTCLYWAKRHFKQVYALCFEYGQRHELECEIAKSVAEQANVEFCLMDARFIAALGSNALTDRSVAVETAGEHQSNRPCGEHPNTFVPGRNLFFLSIAAVYARDKGARNIITGVSQTDYSGYPDCRDTFIRSLNTTLNLAMEEQFIIHTPLMWLTKAETWALADELGVVDVVYEQTLTCYNGIRGEGCGECPACVLRRNGWKEYREQVSHNNPI